MIDGWGRYDARWTDLSKAELVNFVSWMNRFIGGHPTIIGGWAVNHYNPEGYGSVDIDVVLPGRETRDRVINLYLASNGYEIRSTGFGTDEWVKELEPGNPESVTYLDVCTIEDRNLVHGTRKEVPWALAHRYQASAVIDGAAYYVPKPETLLVLKAKAAWDRAYDLRQIGDDAYLRGKIAKDRYDIVSIVRRCQMDTGLVRDIVTTTGFDHEFEIALGAAVMDDEVASRHMLDKGARAELRRKARGLTS